MNTNELSELRYNTTRGKVTTTRGVELPIKHHRGWQYVNYNGRKIGLSQIKSINTPEYDFAFDYIFNGLFLTHPCPAISYLIYRHRLGNKISVAEYYRKFVHKTT